jgi:hypothetical protein
MNQTADMIARHAFKRHSNVSDLLTTDFSRSTLMVRHSTHSNEPCQRIQTTDRDSLRNIERNVQASFFTATDSLEMGRLVCHQVDQVGQSKRTASQLQGIGECATRSKVTEAQLGCLSLMFAIAHLCPKRDCSVRCAAAGDGAVITILFLQIATDDPLDECEDIA